MTAKGYKSTALPEDLIERIETVVKANVGYISVIDFIKEAVRMRLDELEQKNQLLKKLKKELMED